MNRLRLSIPTRYHDPRIWSDREGDGERKKQHKKESSKLNVLRKGQRNKFQKIAENKN